MFLLTSSNIRSLLLSHATTLKEARMKWYSQPVTYSQGEHVVDGWHLESLSDYDTHIRCLRCLNTPRVNDCVREAITGIGENTAAAPVFHLLCPACAEPLADLDESSQEYAIGPVPRLNLRSSAELVDA